MQSQVSQKGDDGLAGSTPALRGYSRQPSGRHLIALKPGESAAFLELQKAVGNSSVARILATTAVIRSAPSKVLYTEPTCPVITVQRDKEEKIFVAGTAVLELGAIAETKRAYLSQVGISEPEIVGTGDKLPGSTDEILNAWIREISIFPNTEAFASAFRFAFRHWDSQKMLHAHHWKQKFAEEQSKTAAPSARRAPNPPPPALPRRQASKSPPTAAPRASATTQQRNDIWIFSARTLNEAQRIYRMQTQTQTQPERFWNAPTEPAAAAAATEPAAAAAATQPAAAAAATEPSFSLHLGDYNVTGKYSQQKKGLTVALHIPHSASVLSGVFEDAWKDALGMNPGERKVASKKGDQGEGTTGTDANPFGAKQERGFVSLYLTGGYMKSALKLVDRIVVFDPALGIPTQVSDWPATARPREDAAIE